MKLFTAALLAAGANAALDKFNFDLGKLRSENRTGLKLGGNRDRKPLDFDLSGFFNKDGGLFDQKEEIVYDKFDTVKDVKTTDKGVCPKDFCQNGGACVGKKPKFFCNCPKGFTGTKCETEVDFCTAQSCDDARFGLACVSMPSGFQCRIPESVVTDPNSLFVSGGEVIVNPGQTQAEIQLAIDNAADFSTIIFEAGTYSNIQLNIPKNLKLVGAGSGDDETVDTILDGMNAVNGASGLNISGGAFWIIENMRIQNYGQTDGQGIDVQEELPGDTLLLNNLFVTQNANFGLAIGGNNEPELLKRVIIKNSTFKQNGDADSFTGDILFFQYAGAVEMENVIVMGESSDTGTQAAIGIQFRSDLGFFNTLSLKSVSVSGFYQQTGIAFKFEEGNLVSPPPAGLDLSTLVTEDVTLSAQTTNPVTNVDCVAKGPVDFSGIRFEASAMNAGFGTFSCSQAQEPVTYLTGTGPFGFFPGNMDKIVGNGSTILVLPVFDSTPETAWQLGVEVDKNGEVVSFSSAGATFGNSVESFGCLALENITEIVYVNVNMALIAETNIEIFPTITVLMRYVTP